MTTKMLSKTSKGSRPPEPKAPLGDERFRESAARFPEQVEEELPDHYWGTSETYWDTYFNIPTGN